MLDIHHYILKFFPVYNFSLSGPVIELAKYEVIGLIEFSSESAGQLGIEATRKFIDNLHGAQPGVRILEIGNQKDILNKLGR